MREGEIGSFLRNNFISEIDLVDVRETPAVPPGRRVSTHLPPDRFAGCRTRRRPARLAGLPFLGSHALRSRRSRFRPPAACGPRAGIVSGRSARLGRDRGDSRDRSGACRRLARRRLLFARRYPDRLGGRDKADLLPAGDRGDRPGRPRTRRDGVERFRSDIGDADAHPARSPARRHGHLLSRYAGKRDLPARDSNSRPGLSTAR